MCCNRKPLFGLLILALAVGAGLALDRISRATPPTSQPTSRPAAKALVWHDNLDQALAAARQDHSLVLVDVWADWCGWCHKLDRDTLSNAAVQEKLREFTLLKLDADKHQEVAQHYQVTGLPTTLVLTEKGEVVAAQPGYMPPEEYLKFLAAAKERAAEHAT